MTVACMTEIFPIVVFPSCTFGRGLQFECFLDNVSITVSSIVCIPGDHGTTQTQILLQNRNMYIIIVIK